MTEQSRAHELLRKEYGDSANFMTPDVLRVGLAGDDMAWELSQGRGFEGETIWGVSVVIELDDGTTDRPLEPFSQLFHSRAKAEAHIQALKDGEVSRPSEV